MELEKLKDEFLDIYTDNIKNRPGSYELLDYLLDKNECDFTTAPASTKYHCSHEGGLMKHSINVYRRLDSIIKSQNLEYSNGTVAIVSLLHDLCKINNYTVTTRNVKKDGIWIQEPYYITDDKFCYGHGEKSVFIISKFMKLYDEEAMAIRWHMAFSGEEPKYMISAALKQCPLAVALSSADMFATFLDENENH